MSTGRQSTWMMDKNWRALRAKKRIFALSCRIVLRVSASPRANLEIQT
jgi:hypothetical protein